MKRVLIALGSVVILAFSGCGASGTVSSPGVTQDVAADGTSPSVEGGVSNSGVINEQIESQAEFLGQTTSGVN